MCIARLELSTQPCQHRWYRLHHRCSSDLHLGNCPNKLQLQGWETRTEHCPFCEDWPQSHEEYRLLGQTYDGGRLPSALRTNSNPSSFLSRSSQSSSPYSSCSRTPSLSRHLLQTGHNVSIRNTKGSQSRWGKPSESSVSTHGRNDDKNASVNDKLARGEIFRSSSEDTYSHSTCDTGTKNRAMNKRLEIYLNSSVPRRLVIDGPVDGDVIKRNNINAAITDESDVNNVNNTRNTMEVAGNGMPSLASSTTTSRDELSNQAMSVLPVFGKSHDDWTTGIKPKQKSKRKGINTSLGKKLGFLFLN